VGAQQDPHPLRGPVGAVDRDPFGTPGCGGVVVFESAGRRLNEAFAGFFRRVKTAKPGVKPGYPRFKGKARFDSVEWPKDGDGACWLPEQRRVYLQGVGQVKVELHRQVAARVKTIQIKRVGRHWMLVLSCDEVVTNALPATGRQAGVDVGIVRYATLSDGTGVENPRWARAAAERSAAAQQRLARAKLRSKNRQRRRETVAARYRKIANQRKDFHHKQARALVGRYDLLVVEDLQIANMLRRAKPAPDPDNPGQFLPNGARAKSGLNISWGMCRSVHHVNDKSPISLW
jgi:putative transposase